MLYTQTVEPATLGLLKQLMVIPELDKFVLVGGTNLSFQLGHRLSIDLDLFTNEPFHSLKIQAAIREYFPGARKLDEMKQTIWYEINGVKTDIILHQYPYLKPIQEEDGIRFLSIQDIIPMKLGAVAGRGAKKDFWDIAELLNNFTINEMMKFYSNKYTSDDIGYVLRSLAYFEDAEVQNDPVSLKDITWNEVKKKIKIALKEYTRNNTE